MKNKEFEFLSRRLLGGQLAKYYIKGSLIAILPVNHLLRGLSFESSSFDRKAFYVNVFFLPLYVPAEFLNLYFGKRLSRQYDSGWNSDETNLVAELRSVFEKEALPFLSRIESPEDVAKAAEDLFEEYGNVHAKQAAAYSWAKAGYFGKAADELDRLIKLLNLSISWQRDMFDRALILHSKLTAPGEVAAQLEAWEQDSLKNLGLNELVNLKE